MLFVATRGLPLLIEVGLLIYAIVDCIQTPVPRHLPKWAWILLIVVLPLFGSIAWLVLGRPDRRAAAVPWPATGTAGYPEYERPGRAGRSGRSVAPDDDPDFLAGLAARHEDERRLAAWEENLRRREEDLRPGGSPDAPGTTPPDDAAPGAPGRL